MRIAILSADVAGGHDAAARTLRDELVEAAPDADVTIDNGLAAAGTALHRFVRDGFKLQLGTSGGSYGLMVHALARRPVYTPVRGALGRIAAGGVRRLVERHAPDLVVSTYPVVTAALGHLRARGELRVPVAAPIMDAAPHPMWMHGGVDLHLVPIPRDVERARGRDPDARVRHARPLIPREYLEAPSRAEARRRVGLDSAEQWVLVDHSAWNVPPAQELVDPLLARSDARVIVNAAAFEDEEETRKLRHRYSTTSRVQIRTDSDETPLLAAACDALVTTVASTTAFAALAVGTPAIVFKELPGHGRASADAAAEDGLVLWARSSEELGRIVAGADPWPDRSARALEHGRQLLEAQPAGQAVLELVDAR